MQDWLRPHPGVFWGHMCRDPHPPLFGPVLLGAGGISAHVVFRTPASYGLTVLSLSLTLGPFSPGRGTDPKKAEEGHDPSWHRAGILRRCVLASRVVRLGGQLSSGVGAQGQ